MKTNSKSLGNSFERKIAKELSYWIYNDPNVLKREPTSGAAKDVYIGDIYPIKQLEKNQQEWVFLVECKSGYANMTPTLLNYKIIENWYLKLLKERNLSEKQKVIFLIANFKNRKGILLCTNIELNLVCCKCVLCIKNHGELEWVFCYDYKEVLEYKFSDIFRGKI